MTDLDAAEYLRSLALTERPTEVHETDGGALWRVADDHFVLLICTDEEHEAHKGPAQLRRVMPAEWRIFYAAANPAEAYEVHHWGPPFEDSPGIPA
jgi:hypothetical protein